LLDPLLFSTHQTEGMSKRISSSALGEFAVHRRISNDHVEAYSANGRRAISALNIIAFINCHQKNYEA
jgi:hypothetical protein